VDVNLAELLVALAITGLLLGSLAGALDQGQRVYATGSARVEVTQNARVALARMAAEIRQAGRGPRPGDFLAIAAAEPSRIVLQQDLNGDGVIAGNGETVTWLLRDGVLRRNAGGGAQPIINGVRDLSFTYLDAAGAPAVSPAAIRVVGISLTTEPDHAHSRLAATAPHTVITQVRLRNR
jgi:type II secretory pathway component PulJ